MDLAKIRKKHKKAPAVKEKAGIPAPAAEEPAVPPVSPNVPVEAAPPPVGASEMLPQTAGPADEALLEFVIFSVGGERFAVRVEDIVEIVRNQVITAVPRTHDFVLGVTSLGGKIIPVIDPALRLGIPGSPEQAAKKKLVILRGPKGPAGIILSGAMDVITLHPSMLLEPPPHLDAAGKVYAGAVLKTAHGFVSVISLGEFLDF